MDKGKEKKNSGGVVPKNQSSENLPAKQPKFPKIPKVLKVLNGIKCCAAGVIPYDENGMWLLLENVTCKDRLNDMGGRCIKSDETLQDTAARTFNEETFGISPLSVTTLSGEGVRSFTIGVGAAGPNQNFYTSFFVPTNLLTFELSEEKFNEKRKEEFERTKEEPRIKELKHIPYKKLVFLNSQMSWRLKKILGIARKQTQNFHSYNHDH